MSTWAAGDDDAVQNTSVENTAAQGVPWQPSPINVIPALSTPPRPTGEKLAAEQSGASPPASIAIRAPLSGSTVRGSVVVELDAPPLADGQSLRVYLDGNLVRETRNSTVTLDTVPRGAHHVQAVLHAGGEGTEPIARTERVEFYVQKTSVLLRSGSPAR